MGRTHAPETIQEGNALRKVRDSDTDTNLGPHRRRIDIEGVLAGLREIFLPLQIARKRDIPNRERNARSHLELTRYGVAEIALVYKRIDMAVSVLTKAFIVVAIVKSHITRDNVEESAVAVTKTQAIQVIL